MKNKVKKRRLSLIDVENILKKQTLLFSMWGCENEKSWPYQWYPFLKKIFKEVILFDPRKKRIQYGAEEMKKKFFDIVRTKKPNYFLFLIESNNINIEMIEKINKLSPNTKTIVHFGDDDIHFEDRSRYYALFIDYCLIAQVDYISNYKKEGLLNTLPINCPLDIKKFMDLRLKKIYDLSFIGQPYPSRVKIMRFLIENGIKINLWGNGWHNVPHLKGRVFEVAACKSFQLVDYYKGYLRFFKEDEEIVMFKDRFELLKKIKYYLKNEKEREKIAERAYKKIIKNNKIDLVLKNVFKRILEANKFRKSLPTINKKFIEISKKDINDGHDKLKERLKDYDYVSFSYGKSENHKYKNYLQIYSLEKTRRNISCCNYFFNDKFLGDYATFGTFASLKKIRKDDFVKLLNLNQIMVSRNYFLNNFEKFKKSFEDHEIDIIDENNTAFVSIPLVRLKNLNKINRKNINEIRYSSLVRALQMNFKFRLQELIYQRKILTGPYLFNLIFRSFLEGNIFILRHLINSSFSKENWYRVKNS